MSRLYLDARASRARLREAARARDNRRDIVKALSWGQVSRRELMKWGLFTSAGLLAPIRGLNPFVSSAYAASSSDIPTGLPSSPLFGVEAFTQPMLRFDVLPRRPCLSQPLRHPRRSDRAGQPRRSSRLNPLLGGGDQPARLKDGRPGPIWAHQGSAASRRGSPIEVTQEGAKDNIGYDPGCDAQSQLRRRAPGRAVPPCFHPRLAGPGSRCSSGRSTARFRRS